ncbi:hypothetical protein [Bradyrhizobium sp. SSUT77]|uniref:hypothetical protein n=1 Tax=Bradyrhizobium sp. SSUT77 TaxID=3040603 RepID=UPI00244C172D|nr:hypothetical protein [Bradyrhizobium sp. SSUT77]MDH2341534.1 hypothetical protein [Bradyrhizobium sp. SSUT77]
MLFGDFYSINLFPADSGMGKTRMQVITAQLAANKELLATLVEAGHIDQATATQHMMDAERLGASGIVLELRAEPQPPRAFKVELSGILSVEPA